MTDPGVASALVQQRADLRRNAAWLANTGTPALSVVVPFLAHDVRPLALRLLELASRVTHPVPLLFVDDGTPDPSFSSQLWTCLAAATQPCLLAVLARNLGRAKVRNYLASLAQTPYVLYLDADMWPDSDDFLVRYLDWIERRSVDVLYGGRSAAKVVLTGPAYRLHRRMTEQREALPASVRRGAAAYHFYSCNFVARRALLTEFPLNESFVGWGWEDCEWACRVAERHRIDHEDNPASHLGLLTATQILQKYDESVDNFRLMLAARPDLLKSTALYRAAVWIGRLGLARVVAVAARRAAESTLLPDRLRMAGLMFYKAALYAPVVRGPAVGVPLV